MSSDQSSEQPVSALLASQTAQTPAQYIQAYITRLRAGDLGSLPIIIGFVIIALIFQSQNQNFLTPRNLVNLIVQMSGYTVIAYGVVFVLLLGEIDLSVGYVSAVAGVGAAVLLRDSLTNPALAWVDWWNVIPIAVLITAAIGWLHGMLITFFQLPSFIVTLAGQLAWAGVVLIIIGPGGTIPIQNIVVRDLASATLPPFASWVVVVVFIGLFGVNEFLALRSRTAAGLRAKPLTIIIGQVALIALVGVGFAILFNTNRALSETAPPQLGMPVIAVIILVLLVILTFITERTRFGRYVYAVGGNKEAARRAGIRVERIRVIVFMLCSALAGFGGIILASRLKSVATDAGGGSLLLYAIAAAVIGGTSLFGGRGKVSSAVLGALVVTSVENGMGLLGLPSGQKFIITGLVLLVSVIIDALSRRRQSQSGIR